MIEVHRHRFARHARKVPFEKCEHWRKVCGRSAKDQIASRILYNKLVTKEKKKSSSWGYNGFTQRRWPCQDERCPSFFYRLFTIHSERFAKGARKMRERRIHSSHVLPKICTAICLREKNESTGIAPREKKQHITSYHNDMLVASTFIRIDNNIFIV